MPMNNIKTTISTQGWQEIMELLDKKIYSLRLAKNIKKDKRFEDIAIETLARAKAVKTLERWIKEINKLGNDQPKEIKKPMI